MSDLTAALGALVTQENADMSDPAQHAAWALASFPSPNAQMGDVPTIVKLRELLSKLLWDYGYRHQPEHQTVWQIPGDHPEAGWMNAPKRVTREEHETWLAAHTDPDAETAKWRDTAEALLGKLDPKLVKRINAMTPAQREAAAEVSRENIPGALERLADLQRRAPAITKTPTPPEFDPASTTVAAVNAHLGALRDPAEIQRVLQAERNGKARNGILKHHKEPNA